MGAAHTTAGLSGVDDYESNGPGRRVHHARRGAAAVASRCCHPAAATRSVVICSAVADTAAPAGDSDTIRRASPD